MKIDVFRDACFFAILLLSNIAAAEEPPEQGLPGEGPGLEKKHDYAPYPKPDSGYVTDLADLLSLDEEEQIEQWLWQTESRNGVEIAVVTINSISDYPGSANQSIESFAHDLFNKYGIGNLPKNDGVLLLVAKNDRKARIELGKKYSRLRDRDAEAIMQNVIVAHFKKQQYADGITDGVKAIMLEFAGARVGMNWTLIVLLVAVPVVTLIAISLFQNGKRGWGWVCVGILIVIILAIVRILHAVSKHMPDSSSSSWSSGGFGGGFGGGSSGGGGATGSW